MGNKCKRGHIENTREIDLQAAITQTETLRQVKSLNSSRQNHSMIRSIASNSILEPEDDYLTLVFNITRSEPPNLKSLDEKSEKLLNLELKDPFPVVEYRPLETYLDEKRKHNFLKPSTSLFMRTLARIDFMVKNSFSFENELIFKKDTKRLTKEFLKLRSEGISHSSLLHTLDLPIIEPPVKQTQLKSSIRSGKKKGFRKKVTVISEVEIMVFPEKEGSLNSNTTPILSSQSQCAIKWPCSEVNVSQIFGPIRFGSQEVYMGELKDGLKEGYGIQVWPNGSIYEGYWKQSKRDILGLMVFDDGDVYEGEWKEGKMSGIGIFKSADTFEYQGSFEANEAHGRGQEHWMCGISLRGTWETGKRKGEFLVRGDDWELTGTLLGNDSVGPMKLIRGNLRWNLTLNSGDFEGAFECREELNDVISTFNGVIKNGKVEGDAQVNCSNRLFYTTYSKNRLVRASIIKDGQREPLNLKNGRVSSIEASKTDSAFIQAAVGGLEGVNIPFL